MPSSKAKKQSGRKNQSRGTAGNVVSLSRARDKAAVAKAERDKERQDFEHEKRELCDMMVHTIMHALSCKDRYTFEHSTRVAYFSLALGREVGLSEEELYDLEIAALFHDLGKIGIPDAILLKPSRLTEDEFVKMKGHPSLSAEIIAHFKPFEKAAKYAKHHHERYDGRGYPDALKGEDIPLLSRIILIADTFDAITSNRPYRQGLSYEVAFRELEEFSGGQFDPNLVEHFCQAMRREHQKGEDTFKLTAVQGEFLKQAA